jgi:uncharacterized protein (TIGR01777 family)
MKIVIPGGSGQIGRFLVPVFRARGDEVVVISRRPKAGELGWDGKTPGAWTQAIDGADVVINLAGRSVNCRYTRENLADMMASRVDSTRVVGEAIAAAKHPPRVWLQMSTATIYAHTYGEPNDEAHGTLGGHEPDVPRYWDFSIEIAKAWERTLEEAPTPYTRKVALRSAIVMSAIRGGVFSIFATLARLGLGGPQAGGRQFMSWIHERDFLRSLDFIISHEEINGIVNLASPNPIPQREFLSDLRRVVGTPVGIPSTKWLLEIMAFVHRTDTELLLKSRRVIPGRLLEEGFVFEFPNWAVAAEELYERWRGSPQRNIRDGMNAAPRSSM